MPIYEYEYQDDQGKVHRLEKIVRKGSPEKIEVVHEGKVYEASRVVSLTAKMALNWEVKGTSSDMPAENSPYLA